MNPTAPKSLRKPWTKRLLWLALIALIPLGIFLYHYGFLMSYILLTGPLGGATIVSTDTSCGDGEYRIVVYQYQSGDGYLALTNRAGKVFDTTRYARGVDYAPFDWDKNCKRVMVGSNEGLVFLKVK
jgi:hypothetical protein